MVYCTINLENSSIFHAGQLLKGNVELHLNEPRKIRAFWINIHGTARCFWTKQEDRYVGTGDNRRRETYTVNCEGKEVYLNQKHFLLGNEYENAVQIASGTHTYEFECLLPTPLPASLRLPYGTISYEVEAVLDIPWSFDKEFRREFIVVRTDNFSNQPDLMIPLKSEEIKKFCCFCCESDPLIVTVILPKTGFLPGELIPITIDYVNKSDVEISKTTIFLKQIVKYTCQTPETEEKCEKENILEYHALGVGVKTTGKVDVELTLPAHVLPTNIEYCKVIKIYYELKLSVISEGFHMDVDFSIPITIGSTPKSENYIFGNIPSAPATTFNLNVSSRPTTHSNFIDPNLPPPSFDEAIGTMKPLLGFGQFSHGMNQGSYGWSGPIASGYQPTTSASGYPQAGPNLSMGQGYPPIPYSSPGYPPQVGQEQGHQQPPLGPGNSPTNFSPGYPISSTVPSAPPE